MRPVLLLALPLTMALTCASAQPVVVQPRPAPDRGEVRVQVNVNFFVPGPVTASDESFQAQEKARRAIYERAGKECELLKATIASECRLEAVNVNVNRQFNQLAEGFVANASMTYKITQK
jgi:hypothetical protein